MSETAVEDRFAIRTFVAYRVVSRLYFHLSILFVFLLHQGHTVLEITVALAAYGIALSALTPVASAVMARLGPVRALTVGELLKASGLALLVAAPTSLVMVCLGQVLNAAGFALAMSGDPAVVNQLGSPTRVRALQASTQSLMFMALLGAGVAGGALYLLDPRWPLLAGTVAALCAAALAESLRPRLPRPETSGSAQRKATSGGRMLGAEIRWTSYYILTRGFMLGVFVGLVPYLVFRVIEVNVLTLTLVLAAYSLAAFLAARYVAALMAKTTTVVFAMVTGVVLLLALVTFAVSSSLVAVLIAMVLLGAASGGVRPATMAGLSTAAQQGRSGPVPSWLLSRMETLFGVCNAGVILAGGLVTYFVSWTAAMVTLVVAYLVIYLVSEGVARSRHDQHTPQPQPS